jgi:hypothetical protein
LLFTASGFGYNLLSHDHGHYLKLTPSEVSSLTAKALAALPKPFNIIPNANRRGQYRRRRRCCNGKDQTTLPRLDTFCNPLAYTFHGGRGPSIMTMSRALAP